MSAVLLTIRQAADTAALSEKSIREAINSGALRAKNVGRIGASRPTIRIRPEDLNEWANSLTDVIS